MTTILLLVSASPASQPHTINRSTSNACCQVPTVAVSYHFLITIGNHSLHRIVVLDVHQRPANIQTWHGRQTHNLNNHDTIELLLISGT